MLVEEVLTIYTCIKVHTWFGRVGVRRYLWKSIDPLLTGGYIYKPMRLE